MLLVFYKLINTSSVKTLVKGVIIVKLIKNIAVFVSLFCCLGAVQAQNSIGIEVRCRVESEAFLTAKVIDQYTNSYRLSAPPTKVGGRHLLWENQRFELWLKTDAYTQSREEFRVTGFSAVLLDKQKKLMSEASSSSAESPRRATLTMHNLSEDLTGVTNRLILTCVEKL